MSSGDEYESDFEVYEDDFEPECSEHDTDHHYSEDFEVIECTAAVGVDRYARGHRAGA